LSRYGTTIDSEISAIQNLGQRSVSAESLARRARIDEISNGIYQRQLLTDLGDVDYVYRGVSSDLLDIYKVTGKITDPSGRPNSYFSLEYTDTPALFGSKVQVPDQPDVLLKIPVSELVDPKVPRPYWNTATEGFEYRVNSYPKYGVGGNHQFTSGTNSFSEDWIVPGWGNQ